MTPDNWTVSLDADGKTWGAYRNGRLILAGYERLDGRALVDSIP
jgi:hypothetical protein